MTRPDSDFWRGKRVLLTGHTGFKGAWLALWLQQLGARVSGLALAPATAPNLFELARVGEVVDSRIGDIRDAALVRSVVEETRPQLVLHLAAQALVRPSYEQPLQTLASNVMGTAHVLDGLRGCADVRAVVVVTTDKVYRNREWAWPYREDDALGGHDPYSASKAAAELVAACWRDAFLAAQGVTLSTARAGNVIGGGDWSPERLIPDAMRAWQTGSVLHIRRPNATRPWQHVLDPLAAYLRLAEKLWQGQAAHTAYNFGPLTHEAATVRDVVTLARRVNGVGESVFGDGNEGPHEAGWLGLEVARARHELGVSPRWSLEEAVTRTVQWYRRQAEGADARALCLAEIEDYAGRPAGGGQPR